VVVSSWTLQGDGERHRGLTIKKGKSVKCPGRKGVSRLPIRSEKNTNDNKKKVGEYKGGLEAAKGGHCLRTGTENHLVRFRENQKRRIGLSFPAPGTGG